MSFLTFAAKVRWYFTPFSGIPLEDRIRPRVGSKPPFSPLDNLKQAHIGIGVREFGTALPCPNPSERRHAVAINGGMVIALIGEQR